MTSRLKLIGVENVEEVSKDMENWKDIVVVIMDFKTP